MSRIRKIIADGVEITLSAIGEQDYISLTDMMKAKDGDFFISDWMRNSNTLEYLGTWEAMNNLDFNYGEFAIIKSKAGVNVFKISVKEWVKRTNAIGIRAKAGRYGGTYAHKDIAFNFGMWISPAFQLYVVREYQKLKEQESNVQNLEWNVKRVLAKVNYQIHTDAVKKFIIPKSTLPEDKHGIEYAQEADLLNLALFGCTAKEWRVANPKLALKDYNLRDVATVAQLAVLSNIESLNSILIEQGTGKKDRYIYLRDIAKAQLENLNQINLLQRIKDQAAKGESLKVLPSEKRPPQSSFNKNLKNILNINSKNEKK